MSKASPWSPEPRPVAEPVEVTVVRQTRRQQSSKPAGNSPAKPQATVRQSPQATVRQSPQATVRQSPQATVRQSPQATVRQSPQAMVRQTRRQRSGKPAGNSPAKPQAVVQLALRPSLCWGGNMLAVALNALIMKRKSNLVVSITAPRGCLLY